MKPRTVAFGSYPILLTLIVLSVINGFAFPLNAASEPYPVEVIHKGGYSAAGTRLVQVFEKAPQRILCITPQAAQVLIALGLDSYIIGATKSVGHVQKKYRERFERLNFLTNREIPAREVVVEAQPDIIIGWGSTFADKNLGPARQWHKRGVHTYIMYNTVPGTDKRTIDLFYIDLENLGKIFGIQGKTKAVLQDLKAQFKALAQRTATLRKTEKQRVLTIQHVMENEFYGRSSRDLTCDLIRRAGGIPLDHTPGRQSIERLMALNPDVILIIDRLDTIFEVRIVK